MLSRDFSGLSTKNVCIGSRGRGGVKKTLTESKSQVFSQTQALSASWAGLSLSPDPGKGGDLSVPTTTPAPEQGRSDHSLTAVERPAQTSGGLDLEGPRDRSGILSSDHGTLGRLWNL